VVVHRLARAEKVLPRASGPAAAGPDVSAAGIIASLQDVVGQLGGTGNGAMEVVATR